MKGKCYIDNIDIYEQFGVMMKEGGYKDLLTFPALKEPTANDWPEEDGVEVDLESPAIQIRTITIPFVACNPLIEANDFISFMSRPSYHILHVADLKKSWNIRLNTQSANEVHPQATSFSLQFTDDIPTGARSVHYNKPKGGGIPIIDTGYEVDSIPLHEYGIVVESGLDDLLKSPTIKQNLTRSYKASDGQQYDTATVVFNSKESTLKCCFITSSVEKFWECYTAFFNDLIQPKERILYCDYTGEEYPCYYKKSSNFHIEEMKKRFVCTFQLTLEFISFRINETEYILTTEDGKHLVLEDGQTAIDLRINNIIY